MPKIDDADAADILRLAELAKEAARKLASPARKLADHHHALAIEIVLSDLAPMLQKMRES